MLLKKLFQSIILWRILVEKTLHCEHGPKLIPQLSRDDAKFKTTSGPQEGLKIRGASSNVVCITCPPHWMRQGLLTCQNMEGPPAPPGSDIPGNVDSSVPILLSTFGVGEMCSQLQSLDMKTVKQKHEQKKNSIDNEKNFLPKIICSRDMRSVNPSCVCPLTLQSAFIRPNMYSVYR